MTPFDVATALGDVIDPELGIDIVSLGLVYGIHVDDRTIDVQLTMTSPDCPMGEAIAGMAAARLGRVAEDRAVSLDLVTEPAWNIRMAAPGALRKLGLA